MALLDRLKKNSQSKIAAPLGKVKIPDYSAKTDVLAINIALAGDLDGEVTPGHTIIAGDSRHFKCLDGATPLEVYTLDLNEKFLNK